MPSLKDLRGRIASVKATQKITKAMQMVAAANLRRAQSAAEAARPYADRMESVLANLTSALSASGGVHAPLLAGTGKDDVHLLVVMTAERGLCGGFNSSIARLARDHARRLLAEGKTVKILCVGRKGADVLRRQFSRHMLDTIELRGVRRVGFDNAEDIARRLIQMYGEGGFDICTMFFARFRSVIAQIPTATQIIPAKVPEAKETTVSGNGAPPALYTYEPDEEEILADLLPRNVAVQVFRALQENAASEWGARMAAMDSATRNAGDMITRLTMTYNRTRQAMITKELIEIISGAEAL